MALFDELGLAERSTSNPLKVLHSKLEYGGKEEGISFVGISNYSLDAAKINRALVLSVPDLDQKLDELIKTSMNIVKSICNKLEKEKIFEIISNTYFSYKELLQFFKELIVYKKYVFEKNNQENNSGQEPLHLQNENTSISHGSPNTQTDVNNEGIQIVDESQQREKRTFESIKGTKEYIYLLKKEKAIRKDFHGNRDFYNLIRGIAIELSKSGDINDNEKVPIIIQYIERNIGGIDYEIDIDLNLTLEDTKEKINLIKIILQDYESYDQNKKIKLNSVFLFKKLYNLECEKVDPNSNLRIDKLKINEYDLNNCINQNLEILIVDIYY